jgi:hypothetical protein
MVMAENNKVSEIIAGILLFIGIILLLSSYRACNDARNPAYRVNYSLGYEKENLVSQTGIYFLSGAILISISIVLFQWEKIYDQVSITFSKKKRFQKADKYFESSAYFANLDLNKGMKKTVLKDLINAIELNYEFKQKSTIDERFKGYWEDPDFIELTK